MFHGKQHLGELGLAAVNRFLELVRSEKQPLSALESARSAHELLWGTVLGIDLGELPRPLRLFDQRGQVLRAWYYAPRTQGRYLPWARRSCCYGKRHPHPLAAAEDWQRAIHL